MLAKLGINFIPISEHAMMGFAYQAIQEYQMDNKIQLIAYETLTKDERIKMVDDILGRIKIRLLKAIVKPEESDLLDKAIGEVLDFYIKNLAD